MTITKTDFTEWARKFRKVALLPSRTKFLQLVEAVERAGAWCSRDCAGFLRGLAFTGCQKSEAAELRWRDLDFTAGEIVVRGDPETVTKNWAVRRVPMVPDARALFERMRDARADELPNEKVFRVNEAQRAIDSAGAQTRHSANHSAPPAAFVRHREDRGRDRHPNSLPWLGHKDGGALALKTYGHLRREHSVAQALKVSFARSGAFSRRDSLHRSHDMNRLPI